MQLLSGDRLKQVLTTVMAALLGGCASFAPYVPVEDGQPFATLVVPSRITSWRPGSVGSTTLNFAIANEQGCGNFVKPEPATQERSEVRYKIPINKDILIGYARDSGVMTCNVSASISCDDGRCAIRAEWASSRHAVCADGFGNNRRLINAFTARACIQRCVDWSQSVQATTGSLIPESGAQAISSIGRAPDAGAQERRNATRGS